MTVAQPIIHESDLQHLLRQAAAESVAATAAHCVERSPGSPPGSAAATDLEEELAWIAARVTERGWDLLPTREADARAPIAWAVQEIIEWAEHMVRLEALGDAHCRIPLTWLPRGTHPLGSRDVAVAVAERAALLREELAEHGVTVAVAAGAEVAA
jgi:hypothetical protein